MSREAHHKLRAEGQQALPHLGEAWDPRDGQDTQALGSVRLPMR